MVNSAEAISLCEDSIYLAIAMLLDLVMAYVDQTLIEAAACATGVESKETPLPMEPFTLLPQQPVAPAVHDQERRPRSRSTAKQRTPQAPGLPAPAVVSGQTPRTRKQKPVHTDVYSQLPEVPTWRRTTEGEEDK